MTDTPTMLPSHAAILRVLGEAAGPITANSVAKRIIKAGGLRLDRRTVVTGLNELHRAGRITDLVTEDGPRCWTLATPGRTL